MENMGCNLLLGFKNLEESKTNRNLEESGLTKYLKKYQCIYNRKTFPLPSS